MSSDGGIDQQKNERTRCDDTAKNAKCGEREEKQQEAIKQVHGPPNARMDGVRIVVGVHDRLDKIALFFFVVQKTRCSPSKRTSREGQCRYDLDEWRMLRVEVMFAGAKVRDASGDMPRLVNGEPIASSGPRRAEQTRDNQ